MTTHTDTDPALFIRTFFTDFTTAALDPDVDPEAVVDRFHTRDVLQVADGVRIDHARMVDHLRPVRKNLQDFSIEVHDAVAEDGLVAAHFTIRAVMRRRPIDTEVAFFGRFTPDGRLQRAHQLTRTLPQPDGARATGG